jgi:AcrR family transcriptional regulator
VPRSSEPARRQLLDTALRLFAAQGIAAVSLREIRIAAKQRNAGALHYHFGSKEGLLRALLERELPPLVARRRALLAEAAALPAGDLRPVAAIFVLPFAEMATGTERERSATPRSALRPTCCAPASAAFRAKSSASGFRSRTASSSTQRRCAPAAVHGNSGSTTRPSDRTWSTCSTGP